MEININGTITINDSSLEKEIIKDYSPPYWTRLGSKVPMNATALITKINNLEEACSIAMGCRWDGVGICHTCQQKIKEAMDIKSVGP